jgi:hypothetical protein
MFFRRRFFRMVLVLLLMLALFGIVSRTAYNAGWTQGYFFSQQSAGGAEGGTAVPYPYAHHGYPGWGLGRVLFGGLSFLAFGLFSFLALGFLGRHFLFRRGWKKEKWQGKWQYHHGHTPPWFDVDDADEPIMKA